MLMYTSSDSSPGHSQVLEAGYDLCRMHPQKRLQERAGAAKVTAGRATKATAATGRPQPLDATRLKRPDSRFNKSWLTYVIARKRHPQPTRLAHA